MRVGYGKAKLSVPVGTPMGGYVDRPGPSTGILDPLEINAITWHDGERRLALVIADVICVNEDLATRARQIAGCELWLAADHTHAGPETGCVPGGGPTPPPWLRLVADAVGSAVRRAVGAERSGEGSAHSGELRGVGADRSRPEAEAVVPLEVLAIRDGERLAGVVAVLPVHPTVLPPANRLVSADLVGAARRALRQSLGPDVWVVVATGAAGDISTRHTRRGQDVAELERLGAIVAGRCLQLLAEPPRAGWSAGARIRHAGRRVELRRSSVDADVAELTEEYRRAGGDPVAARLARSRLEALRARTAGTGAIGATVQVARIGGLELVGLPGEPFLATARSIGGVVLGYVNGYPGYLPTADAYRRTEYEVLSSQVAQGSAETLARTARELLEEL